MRIESPSTSKSGFKHGKTTADGKPGIGSAARRAYDLFQENRGVPVTNEQLRVILGNKPRRSMEDLTDYWGLDIRSIPDCHYKCLVGEWFGDKYVDYIADKLKD